MDDSPSEALSHDPSRLAPLGPCFHEQTALYRLRAEEYERNFLSLRAVEWQLVFQTYAGYATVGAGLAAIHAKDTGQLFQATPSGIALGMLALIFFTSLFCQIQLQHRMHWCRDMQNLYLDSLHELLAPKLALPAGKMEPIFPKWWAFTAQLIMNAATLAAIVTFILRSTQWCWK